MGTRIELRTDGGSFGVYLAEPAVPARSNGSGIVLLQEIFGLTSKIRAYCDMLAAEGYVVLAPDLFWRMEAGVELTRSPEDITRAFGFLKRLDEAAALADVATTTQDLRARVPGKLGVVGFCLGGKLAALICARGGADAGAGFYGVDLDQHLDALARIRVPLQLHFGGRDEHIPAQVRAAIEPVVRTLPEAEFHVYAEAGHAFFRADLADPASQLAWQRTLAFLARALQP